MGPKLRLAKLNYYSAILIPIYIIYILRNEEEVDIVPSVLSDAVGNYKLGMVWKGLWLVSYDDYAKGRKMITVRP